MSADNGFVIRNHPKGGYAVIMEFMSDDSPTREVTETDTRYPTLLEAMTYAQSEYSEYGTRLHSEVYGEMLPLPPEYFS